MRMDFEGHRFNDLVELTAELRASWPGVWVEPREGGDPLPFTWALRLGDQHPGWQRSVVAVLTDLIVDPDEKIAFGAIESLRAAPWDVGPALAEGVVDRLAAFAARTSARLANRSALADVATLLAQSAAKAAMPERLAGLIATYRDERDGFPDTMFVALAMHDSQAATSAAEALADWVANAGAATVEPILAQGLPASEAVARVLARSPSVASTFAATAKERLESAAMSLETSLKSSDYPAVLKTRLQAARGSHAKRWASLAAVLGVAPGRFIG